MIDAKSIEAVVAMVPHPRIEDERLHRKLDGKFYVGEKMGLDIMALAGIVDNAHVDNQ